VLSHAPARIGADEEQGQELKVGSFANIAIIDPTAKRTIVAESASKSKNSPYISLELPGRVMHTVYRGYFTVRDGLLASEGKKHD